MIQSVDLLTGNPYQRGIEYEVADGTRIQNQGEKKFLGITEEGINRRITAQVCDVNKGLLSVGRMVGQGHKVVFDRIGSYIEDERTKQRLYMREERGLYMLKLWVKARVVVFKGTSTTYR